MDETGRLRTELLGKLQELLGEELAALVMESLPPDRWSELATRKDLLAMQEDLTELRADVAGLQHDVAGLQHDVADLRHDVVGVRHDVADLRHDVAGLQHSDRELHQLMTHRAEVVDLTFADLKQGFELRLDRHEARTEALVRERFDSQTKLLVFSIIGALLTSTGIAITAGAAL